MKNIVVFLILLVLLSSIAAFAENSFVDEYEALNGLVAEDGIHEYAPLEFSSTVQFEYVTFDQLRTILTEETAIVYFGFPECPWCRSLLPYLEKIYEQMEIEKPIACFNAKPLRDTKELSEVGTIITTQEAAPEYDTIVDILKDHLGEYEGLNDPAIKRLYFPTVVAVRDGEILGVHIGTLDEVEDPYLKLDTDQEEKLKDLLYDFIVLIK